MEIKIRLTKAANLAHYGKAKGDIIALDLESEYLPICVSSEIYESASRTPIEAKKAQAVASRTFILSHAKNGTVIDDTASFQAFNWKDTKTIPGCVKATKETAGQVLLYDGKMITAWYSNSSGGRTKRSDEAWSAYKPWTVSKDDPWDVKARQKWGETKASHGVGMSQMGAAYAASIGGSYQDILAFYYPGTALAGEYGEKQEEGNKLIQKADLCAYAMSAIGGGYCYGSSGEVCSLANRKAWAAANPSQQTNLLGLCAKWDGMRVWDCSGLFRGAWRALLAYRSGGATTIYKTWLSQSGTIDKAPDLPGIALFKAGTGSTMSHIGLYVGDGMVIDARSSSRGVVFSAKDSYPWTHFGQFADVDYQADGPVPAEALYSGAIKTKTGGGIGLWVDSTKKTRKLIIPDGARVQVLSKPNAEGFVEVAFGSVTGVCDAQYIIRQ